MLEFAIDKRGEVDSTNLAVRSQLEKGLEPGYVCRARSQSSGYGRQERTWVSPEGGLYQSVLLRPKRAIEDWPTLALVAALAIRSGLIDFFKLERDSSAHIKVKWPNDLLVGENKLVGIACEAHAGGVCLGMGVNIFSPSEPLNLEGNYGPAYISDFIDLNNDCNRAGTSAVSAHNHDELIDACGDAILLNLACYIHKWEQSGFAAFHEEYCKACDILTKSVQLVLVPGGILASGTVKDIDSSGRLVLQDSDGDIQAYSSGEVHISSRS